MKTLFEIFEGAIGATDTNGYPVELNAKHFSDYAENAFDRSYYITEEQSVLCENLAKLDINYSNDRFHKIEKVLSEIEIN